MTAHQIATRKSGMRPGPCCWSARRNTPGWATTWRGSAGSFPGYAVDKQYTLQTADGPKTLAELFDGRSQLLIYHFMFGPSYQAGCPVNCSIADSFDSLIPHLKARDVTLIAVSGAPIEKLLAYRERMGWSFTWASSYGAISTPTSASRAASSRPARRSSRFSTSCRRSRSATPRSPAPTSTAI